MGAFTKPLLLVSGWAHDERALLPLVEELDAGAGCVLTAPHLLRAERYTAGLLEAARKMQPPVAIIGWSLGGMIALEAAAEYPDLFSHVVLISSCAVFCRKSDYEFGTDPSVVQAMLRRLETNPEEVLKGFRSKAFSASSADAVPSAAIGQEELRDGLRYLIAADLRPRLQSFPVPLLLIHGVQDRVISWRSAEFVQQLVPGSSLRLIEKGDHAMLMARPREIAAAIAEFVSG